MSVQALSDTTRRRKPAKPVETRVRASLHRALQRASAKFEELALDAGIRMTDRQFDVLEMVAGDEGCSQTAIVDATGIDRSTLADLVRRLHVKGLLVRKRNKEDLRAYTVKLTEEGRRALAKLRGIAAEADEFALGDLSASERRAFVATLARIASLKLR